MLGDRIVVRVKGNLTFCGLNKGELNFDNKDGLFIETDMNTGLRVWVPKNMVEDIMIIPMSNSGDSECN